MPDRNFAQEASFIGEFSVLSLGGRVAPDLESWADFVSGASSIAKIDRRFAALSPNDASPVQNTTGTTGIREPYSDMRHGGDHNALG
jgi:hypothetical protein